MREFTRELMFLSCLGGSERRRPGWWLLPIFLSCLGGSERPPSCRAGRAGFLSCLGGSERVLGA
ncbi:hypothetical protein CZ787_10670 [Halomonas citrativorans]|uniref:Uncharacterized protein n=1 Tax=Halomonas citrativorans TaxID=2742612 RepID=A0A1R4I173_9GAMM|nr:hypothetical protein CZ787_10670 [Halomonas citrativorans]